MSVSDIPVSVAGTTAVYFLKIRPEAVPMCNTPEAASAQMPNYVEWELLNKQSLQSLERIISLVYLPLLSPPTTTSEAAALDAPATATTISENGTTTQAAATQSASTAPGTAPSLSEEFLVSLRKFASHLRQTIQQVEGDVKLKLPTLSPALIANHDKCLADPDAVKQVC